MDVISKLIAMFKQQTNNELLSDIEAESVARRKRNAERMEKIKADMGEKYILHPNHKRGRLDEPRPV